MQASQVLVEIDQNAGEVPNESTAEDPAKRLGSRKKKTIKHYEYPNTIGNRSDYETNDENSLMV